MDLRAYQTTLHTDSKSRNSKKTTGAFGNKRKTNHTRVHRRGKINRTRHQ